MELCFGKQEAESEIKIFLSTSKEYATKEHGPCSLVPRIAFSAEYDVIHVYILLQVFMVLLL